MAAVHAQAGRLQHYKSNWEVVSRDHRILETIQGYSIDLVSPPFQKTRPHPSCHNQEQVGIISEEIKTLLKKGATVRVQDQGGFFSNLFRVPKKDGGQRPVINLKALNGFVQPHHFKMEGIHTLRELIREGDWLTKVDLKDAYFTLPIHSDSQCFLHFTFQEESFEFTCLPFGLSSASWVFTKTLKLVAGLLRELGVTIIIYIDMLIMSESRDSAGVGSGLPPGMPGLHSKLPEIDSDPDSDVGIPWSDGGHHPDDAMPTSWQDQEDSGRGPETSETAVTVSSHPGAPYWPDECCISSNPPCSSLL